ncbi:eukaryotic translation initiation factor 3 subunit 6, putative [Theileria equi strain WA]|uniref:Eukaryotic translation initiation factor 3 subunit E n=1 Tax=Theileria equi strain WA TaxID=1537102 RepID=L0AUP3_THEEQ|nr:eukaryotic translation initiation factor 3 subunit 6, putative [Theileria equi strain WA]AFZ79270.1 eukaryotic translation initiation factor 3 subunit 6, putative [Theileria equi strain WA]|eukprot:XP_004828936.1 eukaryotic translation initiation factor 3 subunit 6, putative [Theileria equi strain WA]
MELIDNHDSNNYDITSKLSPFLHPKLIIYIIDWLSSKDIYSPEKLASIKQEIETKLGASKLPDEEFSKQEAELKGHIKKFQNVLTCYKRDQLHRIGSNAEKVSISALLQWASLLPNVDINVPLDADKMILKLAKLYFDRQDYDACKFWLVYYVNTVSKYTLEGSVTKNKMHCYWGIIICNLLKTLLPATEEELIEMATQAAQPQDPDNDKDANPLEQNTPRAGVFCILKSSELLVSDEFSKDRKDLILKRSWLLHWSLFYIFKYHLYLFHKKNKGIKSFEWPQLQEYFLDDRNLSVVHLVAPHLLRYYAVYAILNRNRKDHFKVISAAISNAKSKYSDTFTSLLGALFVDFNFEAAQKHIAEIDKACSSDVLLDPLKEVIEENSRHIIFETYCRIHKSINLDLIAQKVNMSSLEAERWIVNIIRHSHVEAKIDSEKNCVEISTVPPNLYQQVIEKTQNLTLRSNMILQNFFQANVGSDGNVGGARNAEGATDRSNQSRRSHQQYGQKRNQHRFTNFTNKDFRTSEQDSLW